MANTLTMEQLTSFQLLLQEGKISEFYTLGKRVTTYYTAQWRRHPL